MTKVIDSTNLGRLVTDIKDKIKGKFWPKDEVVQVDLATVATSGDYNDLINKPTAYVGSKIYVGTCPTAAGTATKVVTVETFPLQNDLPVVGTMIAVKFTNTNTASTPKLNVNGTGAQSIYYNTAVVTSTSAIYGGTANRYSYYMWDGTNWVWVNHGVESNDNTLAYNVRTNGRRKSVDGACYRYRLLFTSTDGMKWVPSNNSTSTNATASRKVNQTPIDPFGPIAYYGSTTALSSGGSPTASTLYEQYATITLGYSFNRTGAALKLSSQAPIYIKCAPQSNGSAIIDSTTPYVQALPSTEDGKIYIYLGTATSATAVDFELVHPIYYYKDGAIRIWTNSVASVDTYIIPITTTTDEWEVDSSVTYSTVSDAISAGKILAIEPNNEGRILADYEVLNDTINVFGSFAQLGIIGQFSVTFTDGETPEVDVSNVSIPNAGIPSGGTTGQVLKKTSNTDYNVEWANESGAVTDVTVGGTSVVSSGIAVIPAIPDVSTKESTSNKVTSLSSSSTDTEYPSAKSVFDFVTDDEYTIATALNEINDKLSAVGPQKIQYIQPSGGLVPNTFYNLGTLSGNVTIDLATPIDSDIENEYKFCFITVSPAPSITWSNYITHWAGNCLDVGTHTPIIDANGVYEVSILDGFAVIIKYD